MNTVFSVVQLADITSMLQTLYFDFLRFRCT